MCFISADEIADDINWEEVQARLSPEANLFAGPLYKCLDVLASSWTQSDLPLNASQT